MVNKVWTWCCFYFVFLFSKNRWSCYLDQFLLNLQSFSFGYYFDRFLFLFHFWKTLNLWCLKMYINRNFKYIFFLLRLANSPCLGLPSTFQMELLFLFKDVTLCFKMLSSFHFGCYWQWNDFVSYWTTNLKNEFKIHLFTSINSNKTNHHCQKSFSRKCHDETQNQ